MNRFSFGRLGLLAALPFALACDDGVGPDGEPSDFVVQVYVESNDTAGMQASETPVPATVTVASNFDDVVLVDSTGADGVIRFAGLAAGNYTVTHVATGQPAGSELRGNASQTVVAPFGGADSVLTRFIYELLPGALSGVAFRDDDGSGSFEAGQDSTFEGIVVRLFAGFDADTAGTPVASDTTDEDGAYDLGELASGDYTLAARPTAGIAVVAPNPRNVTIAPDQALTVDVELAGDPTGPVISIQAARDTTEGDVVKVHGVVTAAQGTFDDNSVYIQDASAAIFVFGVNASLGLEVGDSVQVIGERAESRGEVLLLATSVIVLGTGEVPEPVSVETVDVDAGVGPARLAVLGVTVDSIGSANGMGYSVYVRDGEGESVVFVDADTGIQPEAFTVGSLHSIVGILAVYDTDDDDALEDGEFHLKPRSLGDITAD